MKKRNILRDFYFLFFPLSLLYFLSIIGVFLLLWIVSIQDPEAKYMSYDLGVILI